MPDDDLLKWIERERNRRECSRCMVETERSYQELAILAVIEAADKWDGTAQTGYDLKAALDALRKVIPNG